MDHETVVAYLNRVGVTAPTAGDAGSLRALHRAHQLTVPFEDLSIHLAEPCVTQLIRQRRSGTGGVTALRRSAAGICR